MEVETRRAKIKEQEIIKVFCAKLRLKTNSPGTFEKPPVRQTVQASGEKDSGDVK